MPQTSTIARDDRIESLTSSRCEPARDSSNLIPLSAGRNRALRRLRGPVPINADSADSTQDETYLTDNPAQRLPIKWNRSAMTPNIVSARHHGRSCKAECIINNDISTSGLSDLYASPELARAASSRHRGESAATHRPEIRLTIVPQVMSGRLKRFSRHRGMHWLHNHRNSKTFIWCVGAAVRTSPLS